MESFKYNFRKIGGDIDINAIGGYTQALDAMYKHIAKVTEFNPEKRFIDAVELLEMIAQTNAELSQILAMEQRDLIGELPKLVNS